MPPCGYYHLWKPILLGTVYRCEPVTLTPPPSGPQGASTIRTHKTLFVRFGLGHDNGWPVAKATLAREGPRFPQVLTSRSCGRTCSGQTPPRSFRGVWLLASTSSLGRRPLLERSNYPKNGCGTWGAPDPPKHHRLLPKCRKRDVTYNYGQTLLALQFSGHVYPKHLHDPSILPAAPCAEGPSDSAVLSRSCSVIV